MGSICGPDDSANDKFGRGLHEDKRLQHAVCGGLLGQGRSNNRNENSAFFTTCTNFSLYRVYIRSMDSYQDFSSTRFGSWRIFLFQHFWAVAAMDAHGFHVFRFRHLRG